MSFELFMGYRYLNSKFREAFISLITLLSILGVMVGVMTLIVVIAVMSGTEAHLKTLFLEDQPHILLLKPGGAFSNYQDIGKQVGSIPGVKTVSPYVYSQMMLRSTSGMTGAILKGLLPGTPGFELEGAAMAEFEKTYSDAENGSGGIPGIAVGKGLAEKLNVRAGDQVLYMAFSKEKSYMSGRLPAMRRFKIVNVFESGMHEYDKSFAFIHLKNAQEILKMSDTVTGLEIRVAEIFNSWEISRRIGEELGYQYWARDWTRSHQNLFRALKLQKTVMFIILTLIILVAGFCITGTLIMTVIEKTKDIAILKAMGVTDASIRFIFVFKGMVIGVIGTVLGICFGFVVCALLERYQFVDLPQDVYYFSKLPVKLEAFDVMTIAISALAICFLATLYPARQASKLDPVEAIRNS